MVTTRTINITINQNQNQNITAHNTVEEVIPDAGPSVEVDTKQKEDNELKDFVEEVSKGINDVLYPKQDKEKSDQIKEG